MSRLARRPGRGPVRRPSRHACRTRGSCGRLRRARPARRARRRTASGARVGRVLEQLLRCGFPVVAVHDHGTTADVVQEPLAESVVEDDQVGPYPVQPPPQLCATQPSSEAGPAEPRRDGGRPPGPQTVDEHGVGPHLLVPRATQEPHVHQDVRTGRHGIGETAQHGRAVANVRGAGDDEDRCGRRHGPEMVRDRHRLVPGRSMPVTLRLAAGIAPRATSASRPPRGFGLRRGSGTGRRRASLPRPGRGAPCRAVDR